MERTVAAYASGHSGFWLAWVLRRAGSGVQVIQPVSVPADRRACRAKTNAIDVNLLLRICLAFLRGEPRVCSTVPVPEETDEDTRHPGRGREELITERIALTDRIGGILTTLGVDGYDLAPLLQFTAHESGSDSAGHGERPVPAEPV